MKGGKSGAICTPWKSIQLKWRHLGEMSFDEIPYFLLEKQTNKQTQQAPLLIYMNCMDMKFTVYG